MALFIGFHNYEDTQTPVNISHDSVMAEYQGYETHSIMIQGKEYRVFVADTPELRGHGLSGKTDLPTGFGMEFVFETPGPYGFWMKDMKFPLDIIWVRDGVVVDVWERAPVPVGADIPSYTPQREADRVYEFPAGFVGENGLKVGMSI